MPLVEFVAGAPAMLAEIQQGLFDRARDFRDRHSVRLGSLAEVTDFFTPPAAKGDKGEGIHGGFAHVHVADDPAVAAALDPLKVTVRCIPLDGDDEPGKCVVTGGPVRRRSVLAKAY